MSSSTENRFLLDTHTLLWSVSNPERLGKASRDLLNDPENAVFASIVSYWEIAIKVSKGRLVLDIPLSQLAEIHRSLFRYQKLGLVFAHILALSELTYPSNGHRDPFDRTLVAQAKVEGLVLLSADEALDAYGVTRLW